MYESNRPQNLSESISRAITIVNRSLTLIITKPSSIVSKRKPIQKLWSSSSDRSSVIQRSTHGSSCRIIWMKYKLSVTKFSRSAKQLISADLRKYPTIKPRERVLPPPPYLYLSLSHSLHGPCSRMQPPKNRELVPVSMTRIMGTKKELVGKRGNVTWTGTFAAKRNQILKKKKKKRRKK